MKLRLVRFVHLAFLVVCILLLCLNPISAARTRSGSGTLSADGTRESSLPGYPNGRIEGLINATEGPLEIYVVHSDDYEDLSSLNTLECIVYEYEVFLEFGFDVSIDGDWILILRNPNAYDVHYELTWTSYEPGELSFFTFGVMVFPLFLFLIGLGYVITIQRGVFPETKTSQTSSLLPAIIGFASIAFALLLPFHYQLTSAGAYSSPDNTLFSFLWKIVITADGSSFQIADLSNPYAMISPLLLAGPIFLYPYALMYYYQGRMEKSRMMKFGFISVLPIIAMSAMGLIGWLLSPSNRLYLAIPLPLVLIIGLIVVKLVPAPNQKQLFSNGSIIEGEN